MFHAFVVSLQGLAYLTFGVLYAMWVVRVVNRYEAKIDRHFAEVRRRRVKLVMAGNYEQALNFARSKGWGFGDWKYLGHDFDVAGLSHVSIHQAGEYWLSPVASEVDFRHAHAGVKLVKETAAAEASTGSAAEASAGFWSWLTPEWKKANGLTED